MTKEIRLPLEKLPSSLELGETLKVADVPPNTMVAVDYDWTGEDAPALVISYSPIN